MIKYIKLILEAYKKEKRFIVSGNIIAIAGTMNFDDVLTDLDKYGNDKYHDGFRKIYKKIKPALFKNVKSRNMIITGHSLGGAIARYFAEDLQDRGFIVELITFGEPKCVTFRKFIAKDTRVVNGNDIVPRLGIFKLEHFTKPTRIGKRFFWKFWKRNPIDDHYLSNYKKTVTS